MNVWLNGVGAIEIQIMSRNSKTSVSVLVLCSFIVHKKLAAYGNVSRILKKSYLCVQVHIRCIFLCVLYNDAKIWGHLRICQTWKKKYICSFYIRIHLCCEKALLPKYILKKNAFEREWIAHKFWFLFKSSWKTDYRHLSWALIKC